jgi:CubicO group peptidase (beta-lactamase class C family)
MEKRQFHVLYRRFLFRMVDLDLLSSHAQGDSNRLLGQFAALLVFVSILLSLGAVGGGPRGIAGQIVYGWSMEHIMIATTMLVVGLFAVLSWDSTFPNRNDVLVLAPLPVRPRTLLLAKVAAVGVAMSLTVGLLHILAGFAWPMTLGALSRPAFDVPALNYLPAGAPATASGLESLLQRDIAPAIPPGMGVVIGVLKHGERRVYAYGTAKPDSIFLIGSVSKTFTSLLLAQMAVEGRVRLDQPVRELIPAGAVSKPVGPEITLLDLATHRSGLPPLQSNFNPQSLVNPGAFPPSALWNTLKRLGVARDPSPSFIYSNLGYGVLGEALAVRAGMTYPDLLAAEIAGPLGLRDTATDLTPEQEQRLIQAYTADQHPLPVWYLDAFNGAGGIRSTASDMLAYLCANLRSAAPAFRLQHQLRAEVAGSLQIALGWLYSDDTGTYFHNGLITGYSAHALFNPKEDYAVVLLANQAPSMIIPADVLAAHVQQRLTGKPAVSFATVRLPATGGFLYWLRCLAVYWVVMLLAAAFMFGCVLGLQGLAAQLLPRRLFLRVSSLLQLAAFCVLVCVYFSQPLFVTAPDLMAANGQGLLGWSPSYWFLGLFQRWMGSPVMGELARRAWIGLVIAVGVTAVCYALSYFRTLRQVVEEPDILPGSRRISWLPPFGSRFHTAIVQFTIRTLARSRQHRIVLAFYLGIGFALTILILKSPTAPTQLRDSPAADVRSTLLAPILSSSIIMLCFAIIGTRVVFAIPKDLCANWIFRTAGKLADRFLPPLQIAQRSAFFVLSVAPVLLVTAAFAFRHWPMEAALSHLMVLVLLASVLSDICLYTLHKIPFTCSYLPGKSRINMAFLGGAGLLWTISFSVRYELLALQDFASMAPMLGALLLAAVAVRWLAQSNAKGAEIRFEEEESPAVQVLGLR